MSQSYSLQKSITLLRRFMFYVISTISRYHRRITLVYVLICLIRPTLR